MSDERTPQREWMPDAEVRHRFERTEDRFKREEEQLSTINEHLFKRPSLEDRMRTEVANAKADIQRDLMTYLTLKLDPLTDSIGEQAKQIEKSNDRWDKSVWFGFIFALGLLANLVISLVKH